MGVGGWGIGVGGDQRPATLWPTPNDQPPTTSHAPANPQRPVLNDPFPSASLGEICGSILSRFPSRSSPGRGSLSRFRPPDRLADPEDVPVGVADVHLADVPGLVGR